MMLLVAKCKLSHFPPVILGIKHGHKSGAGPRGAALGFVCQI